jgi:GNAT superfamily N-acetyltransferase
MSSHFTVRPARPADAGPLAALRWAFKHEDHAGRRPAPVGPPAEAVQWIRDRLDHGTWLAWVAESDGEVFGQVFLHLVEKVPEPYGDNAPLGYVTNFYVTPSRRNGGAGSALLTAVARYARSAPLDTLVVWPSERSEPLYRRHGFRPPEELLELPIDI